MEPAGKHADPDKSSSTRYCNPLRWHIPFHSLEIGAESPIFLVKKTKTVTVWDLVPNPTHRENTDCPLVSGSTIHPSFAHGSDPLDVDPAHPFGGHLEPPVC